MALWRVLFELTVESDDAGQAARVALDAIKPLEADEGVHDVEQVGDPWRDPES